MRCRRATGRLSMLHRLAMDRFRLMRFARRLRLTGLLKVAWLTGFTRLA